MPATSAVPTIIAPDAAQRVAELGMQAAVTQMLEHARQMIPGLLRLELLLEGPYDGHAEPYLTIYAYRDLADYKPTDRLEWKWGEWQVDHFPPQVNEHIALLVNYEATDAR